MVSSYFQVVNANNNVVIDDNYKNPTFVLKGEISKDTGVATEVDTNGIGWKNVNGGSTGKIRYHSKTYKNSDYGLDSKPEILGVRCTSSPNSAPYWQAGIMTVATDPDKPDELDGFRIQLGLIDEGHTFEFAMWTEQPRKESGMGMAIYNANGEIVFDAAYGFLQVVDCRYHKYDVFTGKTNTYEVENSDLEGVDPSRLFLIMGSTPRANTGGTIIIKYRRYTPRLRLDATTGKSYVDIAMWGETGGSIVQQFNHTLSYRVAYLQF